LQSTEKHRFYTLDTLLFEIDTENSPKNFDKNLYSISFKCRNVKQEENNLPIDRDKILVLIRPKRSLFVQTWQETYYEKTYPPAHGSFTPKS